jgi:hypothetical protein
MHTVTGKYKYRDLIFQIFALDARLTTLLCKNSIVAKSKEVKAECDLTESSKEGCGSERDDFTYYY